MAMIICGHQRSGTSLLQRLCDRHPDIVVTNEFGNFFDLSESSSTYRRQIIQRWWRAGNRSFFSPHRRWGTIGFSEVETVVRGTHPLAHSVHRHLRINMLQNLFFIIRYLSKLPEHRNDQVQLSILEAALKSIFLEAVIVGDKHPDYAFVLDKLVQVKCLSCVAVYRDPRDVVNSVLNAYKLWGKWWGPDLAIPTNIAKRWVHIIDLMEQYTDKIHIVRYKDLVTDPKRALTALGKWLGVDPQGFPADIIRDSSLGKYHKGLSKQELTDVIQVAGPTMERLGYEL